MFEWDGALRLRLRLRSELDLIEHLWFSWEGKTVGLLTALLRSWISRCWYSF